MENQENIAIECLVRKLLTNHKELNTLIVDTEHKYDIDTYGDDSIYSLLYSDVYEDFEEVLTDYGVSEDIIDKLWRYRSIIDCIAGVLIDVFEMDSNTVCDALSYSDDIEKGIKDLIKDSNEEKKEKGE